MKNLMISCILLFCLSGCFSPKSLFHVSNPKPDIVFSGNVVDAQKLIQGGKIAFTDLKAGPSANADESTDKASLKIISGVTQSLTENPGTLTITTDPHDADFILEGYIEELSLPSNFSHKILFNNHARLAVSGEVYARKTGLRILNFASSTTFNLKNEDPMEAATKIGKSIGDFIVAHETKDQP